MNCLQYALSFWDKNNKYRIYYNGDHVINLTEPLGDYIPLEDTDRDLNRNGVFDGNEKKIMHHTAIPYGKYRIIVNRSPRFKRELPRLLNVPHFTGILIHRGNTAKDTSGCILVGENRIKGGLVNSAKAEIKLTKILKSAIARGEKITIEIV